MTPATPNRARGIVLMLCAGLCWSTGGIIVRSLVLKDMWEIVFWRAFFMAAFLGVLLFAALAVNAWVTLRVERGGDG